MADENLNIPIRVDLQVLDVSLMADWPRPLSDFFIEQQNILIGVANKVNEASAGAYVAQSSNETQSEALIRINQSVADQANLTAKLERQVKANSQAVANGQSDYVSKSDVSLQTLSGPISVVIGYSVDGVKVVGERVLGFDAPTGTDYKGTFDADKTYTVSPSYTQSEVLAIANDLTLARKSIAAILNALSSHGLID